MKAITVCLIVALVLVGVVATALPMLSVGAQPSQVPASQISTSGELAQPVHIACNPAPCDCANC